MNQKIDSIYRYFLKQICDGELTGGELLPPEVAIAEKFNTTRMNAARALQQLKQNNLIVSRKKAGTIIKNNLSHRETLELLHKASRLVYVLYSGTPHYIHYDQTSFDALEERLRSENYKVEYKVIPHERSLFKSIIDEANAAYASSLVIFPDSEDATFLEANNDLLLELPCELIMLNRGNDIGSFDFASSILLDNFSDAINLGRLLLRNGFKNFYGIGRVIPVDLWSARRAAGLNTVLKGAGMLPLVWHYFDYFDEVLQKLRESESENSVVIGMNFLVAAKFIDYTALHNFKCGRDYNLVAFDDYPLYQAYDISGTAVSRSGVGQLFASMILEKSNYKKSEVAITMRLRSKFIQRSSCRMLKKIE